MSLLYFNSTLYEGFLKLNSALNWLNYLNNITCNITNTCITVSYFQKKLRDFMKKEYINLYLQTTPTSRHSKKYEL